MNEKTSIELSPDRPWVAFEEDGIAKGYMCKIDFECELGGALGGNKIYPSIDDLKENHSCWEECGIVEVMVIGVKEIHPGKDYSKE